MNTTTELLDAADTALREGRFGDAERLCRDALTLEPANPIALYRLGVALSKLGNAFKAIEPLTAAVARVPDVPAPALLLASVLIRCSRKMEAAEVCRAFLKRNPNCAAMHSMLGTCHAELRRHAEAAINFRDAIALDPRSSRYRLGLGNALRLSGVKELAIKELEKAAAAIPGNADFFISMGEIFAELGQFENAISAFEAALLLNPSSSWAILGIATTRTLRAGDEPFVRHIQHLLEKGDLPPEDRRTLLYALSKSANDLGEWEAALAYVDRAVEVQTQNPGTNEPVSEEGARDSNLAWTVQTYTRELFAARRDLGSASRLPVLIVGAPRSGTTLLDQILTSHPDIGRGGELLFWLDEFANASGAVLDNEPGAPKVAARYLELLATLAPGKSQVTDKMPMNFLCLGPIHALLPSARIIHCRRHPVDTCLSIYLNGHSISPKPFGESRREIVAGYRRYLRLMDHWRATLPPQVLMEVDYEELVRNRAEVVRRLLEFLQVPWHDGVLRHEVNLGAVSTPSRWQVRQPLYDSSLERWRRYEPYLGEFQELLTP